MPTDEAAPSRTMRVTVRGQFRDLSPETRARLVAAQPEHDLLRSGYTPSGVLSYDERIDFFNARFELQLVEGQDEDDATLIALEGTEQLVASQGAACHRLRVDVVDATAMIDQAARRRR